MNDMALVPQQGGALTQGFGETSMTVGGVESASSAVAAQARATVEARYIMALRKPRNWDDVRQTILRECRRPSFARNQSTWYRKPIGQGVEGFGIRFTEMAVRAMTNCLMETSLIFEDAQKEIHRVTITDLESNTTYPLDVRVSKTVERSKPLDDGSFISVRKNSYGKAVYTVPATDDDLLNKRGALISKAQRTIALRLIPGDILDEAEEIIKSVRMDEAARDPDAERKRLSDAFFALGVKGSDLAAYLGHDIGSCSPAELVELRAIYGAIKDEETSWHAVMENKRENTSSKSEASTPKSSPSNGSAGRSASAKERAKGTAAKEQQAENSEPPATDNRSMYDKIMDALASAKDIDYLDVVADSIRELGDETERSNATARYKAQRELLLNTEA